MYVYNNIIYNICIRMYNNTLRQSPNVNLPDAQNTNTRTEPDEPPPAQKLTGHK